MKYFISIDPKTNKIVERYETISDIVKSNKDYNYQCISNAICKGITYKGYKYKVVDSNKSLDNTDYNIHSEVLNLLEAMKMIGIYKD